MITRLHRFIIAGVFSAVSCLAAELTPPQLDGLYKADAATDVIPLNGGRSAIYVRQRVEQKTRTLKRWLWRVNDKGNASDPRSEAEKRNNVIVVREDQGEGYDGLRLGFCSMLRAFA